MKHLPLYGRFIKQAENKVRDIRIASGHGAWKRIKHSNSDYLLKTGIAYLVFPTDLKPGDFNWSVCADADVLINHVDDGKSIEIIKELATLIIKAGARMVFVNFVTSEFKFLKSFVFKPRRAA